MVKAMKIAYFVLVATLLAIPALSFFGAKEEWTKLYGWEKSTKVVPLTYASYTNRTFQTSFTEDFSKNFFMRKTFLRTSLEIWDVFNLRTFHHGYKCSIMDGRDGDEEDTSYIAAVGNGTVMGFKYCIKERRLNVEAENAVTV